MLPRDDRLCYTAPPMQKPRVAAVGFLNAQPLIWGLAHGRLRDACDLTLLPPHECARALEEGLVDVALIPSIEFVRMGGLIPVRGLGISSRYEVRSVLLLTRGDPGSVGSLAVDINSRTSAALAKLVLDRRYGCRPRTEPMAPDLDAMLKNHDAALLIGDPALKASARLAAGEWEGLRVMDLAREWNEMTNKPFLFAFWACRPVVSERKVRRLLEQSLEEGEANLGRIAEDASRSAGLSVETIRNYLSRNIHYRLGAQDLDSLRVFYRMCWENGLLPGVAREAAARGTV